MNSYSPQNRLRELDFLRGVAILLVLLRHQHFFELGRTLGWIGVDLFFVLSGFLVSGLLFKEYKRNGTIDPLRFLVRRGFKIYPVYYTFFIVYLLYKMIFNVKLKLFPLLADLFFLQNYATGWGYLYDASWSLAVEEHFYFGLTFVLWLALKNGLQLYDDEAKVKSGLIERSIFLIFFICLLLRIVSNLYFPQHIARNFTMTHLRIDSLIAGVYIAYQIYFKRRQLEEFYLKFKSVILIISFLSLSFTPFLDPLNSFFVRTFGFTLLYISFGSILVVFILTKSINKKLDAILGKRLVDLIGRIGFYSYSIYVIHTLVFEIVKSWNISSSAIVFTLSILMSILLGKLISDFLEAYFLRLRDKYYPTKESGTW